MPALPSRASSIPTKPAPQQITETPLMTCSDQRPRLTDAGSKSRVVVPRRTYQAGLGVRNGSRGRAARRRRPQLHDSRPAAVPGFSTRSHGGRRAVNDDPMSIRSRIVERTRYGTTGSSTRSATISTRRQSMRAVQTASSRVPACRHPASKGRTSTRRNACPTSRAARAHERLAC